MKTRITTERLSLDVLAIEDHSFIRKLVNTKEWLQFIGDRKVHSQEDAIGYINKIKGMPNTFYWVVHLKKNSTPIGIITLLKRSYLESWDIGFAFLPLYTGKGYAYEAAKEVLSVLSLEPEYKIILAVTMPENISSIKLLKRLGLCFEKEIQPNGEKLHVYSNYSESCSY